MTTSTTPPIFTPVTVGRANLSHRVVLPPLTRVRADMPGQIPGPLMVEYYRQRATPGGLLITEATDISAMARGLYSAPGIHTPEQIAGWRDVVNAVHAEGATIFLQIWHTGRLSHSSLHPDDALPVAPSPIAARLATRLRDGSTVPYETPHELTIQEIAGIVEDFATAARNAIVAGFDGVEIHGGNGYLIEQFLHAPTNTRTDEYGGSPQGRVRFLDEVTAAVVGAVGADRVGVRFSPFGTTADSGDPDPIPLYRAAIAAVKGHEPAYLHLIEPRTSDIGRTELVDTDAPSASGLFRPEWPGILIAAGGYTPDTATEAIRSGTADLIAFGRHFIANPDLPSRIRTQSPLNPYNRATFYTPGATGYTDYPTLT